MLDNLITLQPLWVIAIATLVGLFLSDLAGSAFREYRWKASKESVELDYVATSVFALLGLLIAFTFGMALDRHETRRNLVVKEANAIGTAHIRTAFADEPDRTVLRKLLEDYAANRLTYGKAGFEKKPPIAAESARLRTEIAIVGVRASKAINPAPLGPSLITSVNDVIDTGSEREAAILATVPTTVIVMLLSYAVIAAFVMGYARTQTSPSQRVGSRLLFVLLALAIVTILDLDRPASGTIKVSQQPMIDLIAGFPK